MAIKANTREMVNLGENIKNISSIGGIVPDTLLGLAETLENRIVLDSTTSHFFENIKNGLDIDKQIDDLRKKITDDGKKIKRPSQLPILIDALPDRFDISGGYVSNLSNTITSLENAEQDKVALKNIIEDNNNIIKNNKGKGATQEETRNKASNTKQIINYDIREVDRIIPLLKALKELQAFQKNYGAILTNRKTEFTEMKELVDMFDTVSNFQDKNINLNKGKDLNDFNYRDTIGAPLPLKDIFFGSNTPKNPSYDVCDINTGKKLEYNEGYTLNIDGKDVKIKGLTIDGDDLKIDELKIDPIDGLKFPVNIKLNIRGSQTEKGISLDVFKPIKINLKAPEMDTTDRERNYDRYNANNVVDNRIESEYKAKHKEREDELIWDLLRSNGNEEEVNKIHNNDVLKKEFIKNIRKNQNIIFPMLDVSDLKIEFKYTITTKKVPLKYLTSDNAFTDYLRNNIAKNVEEFLQKKVKKNIDADINSRDKILTTFTKFQTTMADILSDDKSVRTDIEQTINQTHSYKRKRRDNYMRFLVGRLESLKDQSLELNDQNHKYSINLSCVTMNKLVAEIEVDGKKIPAFAGKNLNELLKSIVKSGRIESHKLAAHIAFATLKSMVKMIKANNMNIDVRNANGNLVETRLNDDKLSINEIDKDGHTVSKIFDEDHFKSLKDFNTLDIALGQLSKDFHRTMHFYNEDYKKATQYTRVNRLMKYDPRGTRGLRRLRKTWNWRKRNSLDFDFPSTAVAVGDRTANISFEKGKFTLSMGDKEYTSRNIGRLLKKNKEFDGMQMEIMGVINEKYIQMLRVNARVKNSNFGVYDYKLKRLYVLDSAGTLNYVDQPNRNPTSGSYRSKGYGRIKDKNMPNAMTPIRDESEMKQFWHNPLLGGRMVKTMQRRLGGI